LTRDQLLQVRLTKDELLQIWSTSIDQSTTLSDYVRQTLLERCRQLEGVRRLTKSPRQPLEPSLAEDEP